MKYLETPSFELVCLWQKYHQNLLPADSVTIAATRRGWSFAACSAFTTVLGRMLSKAASTSPLNTYTGVLSCHSKPQHKISCNDVMTYDVFKQDSYTNTHTLFHVAGLRVRFASVYKHCMYHLLMTESSEIPRNSFI